MDVSEEQFTDMKKKFDASIQEILKRKNTNTRMLTKENYHQTIEKIKELKLKNPNAPREYRDGGFDVILTEDGLHRLIVHNTQDNPKFYVHMEEMFEIVYLTHMTCGHCGRNRMEKEINSKYKNITREMLRNFLLICLICEQKRPVPQNAIEKVKNIPSVNGSSFETRFPRCQVNVMAMETETISDGLYKYILVYKDYRTKFVQLRPLKTCSTKEIAGSLLKIFTIFGAPAIMHSDNGREFASEIIDEITNQWNQIKMVHGQSQSSSLNQDILELIEMSMTKNRTAKWSKCLDFVQLMKNKCRHKAIHCTPFEAMFGSKCKIGFGSDDEDLTMVNNLAEIKTEEELEAIVRDTSRVFKIKHEDKENNTSRCDEGSVDCFESYLTSLKNEVVSEEEDENNGGSTTIQPFKKIKL